MNVYCIPGLGFDRRIFAKLEWNLEPPEYIDWVEPFDDEPLQSYALRMSGNIPQSAEEVALIGHSFGGILSQEIAAQRKINHLIILSSIRADIENPWFFKMMRANLPCRLISISLLRRTFPIWARYHDYRTPNARELFLSMLSRHSDKYLRWALHSLASWRTPKLLPQTTVTQIHGERDRTFPIRRLRSPDHVVPNGGHFMVYNHPNEVSKIIREILEL